MERWQLISEMIVFLEDEGYRPHVLIQTQVQGCNGIPSHLIKEDGRVALNVSMHATNDTLGIGMYQCTASMTFDNVHASIAWHPDSIEAVYSPDGGPKLVFPEPDTSKKPADRRAGRPKLSIVGGPNWEDGPHGTTEDV